MKIRISELRLIIRKEIESVYSQEQLDEGMKSWLAAGALALGLGYGAMKGGGAEDVGKKDGSSEVVPAEQLRPAKGMERAVKTLVTLASSKKPGDLKKYQEFKTKLEAKLPPEQKGMIIPLEKQRLNGDFSSMETTLSYLSNRPDNVGAEIRALMNAVEQP